MDCFQHRRNTVGCDKMSKSKESESVAHTHEKEATIKEKDWRMICKDCEIIQLDSGCIFGCELVSSSLRRVRRGESN